MEEVTIKFEFEPYSEDDIRETAIYILEEFSDWDVSASVRYTWKGEIVDMGKGEKK